MINIINHYHGIKKEGEGALLVGGGETPTAHSKSKHNNGQNKNSDIASEDLARFHTHKEWNVITIGLLAKRQTQNRTKQNKKTLEQNLKTIELLQNNNNNNNSNTV